MAIEKITGSDDLVETGIVFDTGDREAATVIVEGLYSQIATEDAEDHVASGMTVVSSQRSSNGDGTGKLTVRCVKFESGSDFSPVRSTFRVDMQEVCYDLEDHPHVKGSRDTILKWLATDEAKRCGENDTYKYADANGNLVEITSDSGIKFCKAFMAGIKTFNRYYPVIEKISVWKNPPGLSMSGNSFNDGGTMSKFSDKVGKYDSPPLSLSGFSSENFFKSKDSWVQNADTTWTRTEQWTYTPESSSGDHAWIYKELSN